VTPLAVAYDAAQDVLTVEGVRYSGTFFRTLAWPARSRLYRFERRDETVQVARPRRRICGRPCGRWGRRGDPTA